MSQSEVFRPSDGPLLLRGNLASGMPEATDTFRKERPGTQGSTGYRFGTLSHNSFFARHNPHPGRVRHLKGLLDVPICSVNDDGYFASPRYSLQFPPSNHSEAKIKTWEPYFGRVPVNSINVNSQLHPINTITGLQYFAGQALNQRIFREKAVPKMGLVPVTEAWRDELKALTDAVCSTQNAKREHATRDGKRQKTQYSQETGRLIPPPSRGMSRGGSRQGSRIGNVLHITEDPDHENMVLQMLCQVLQTDDVNAVQAWLVSAGDREKSMVMDMIKSVLVSNEEYYRHDVDTNANVRPATSGNDKPVTGMLPAINENGSDDVIKQIDRLSLDGVQPRPASQQGAENKFMRYSYTPAKETKPLDEVKAPVTPDVFRSTSRAGSRMKTAASRPVTAAKSASPFNPEPPKLRYTNTPQAEENDAEEPMWNPGFTNV